MESGRENAYIDIKCERKKKGSTGGGGVHTSVHILTYGHANAFNGGALDDTTK